MSANIPSGYKMGSFQKFTPEQMDLFRSMFQYLGPESFLSQLAGGDESAFEQMERPALRQFGELQGNIASRFSGFGGGAGKSSAHQLAQTKGAQELAENLQSQRNQMQQQALQNLMSFSNQLLGQNPYEQFLVKKQNKPSFFDQLMKYGAPIAGGIAGGPMGAAAGGMMGDWLVNNLPGSVI